MTSQNQSGMSGRTNRPTRGQAFFYPLALGSLLVLAGCTNPLQTATSPSPTETPTESPRPTLTIPPNTPTPTPTSTAPKPESVKTVETKLAELISQATGLTIQTVDCPADLVEKAGTTYNCNVTSEVGAFTAVVQPTDQPGQFKWGTKNLLMLAKLNTFIQQNVQTQGGGPVTVDCGGKAKIAKVGDTFECKVTDAKGASRVARITVRDEAGNVFIAQ